MSINSLTDILNRIDMLTIYKSNSKSVHKSFTRKSHSRLDPKIGFSKPEISEYGMCKF